MTNRQDQTAGPGALAMGGRFNLRRTVLLNVIAPVAAYQLCTNHGLPELQALLVAGAFPLAGILAGVSRGRRLDFVGALSLAAIVFGIIASLVFADPRILLVKESFVTGALGLAFLGSLLAGRPLMLVLARQFAMGDDGKLARYETLWQHAPAFRTAMRRMTAIWGCILVLEAALRVALSFALTPATLLAVSPLLAAAVFGPLVLWTIRGRTGTRELMAEQVR
ncbi:MAG: VC0807 family protein [Chloroflexota bacterium]